MAVIGDGSRFHLDVTYHHEEKPLGTVGALAEIADLSDSFLVMNGDICTNLNFATIYDQHVRDDATATIGTYHREEKVELGVLDLDSNDEYIVAHREKPTYGFDVSMGVNVFNRKVIELIPRGEFFGFDMLMHTMLANDIPVRAYRFDGRWLDIGRPDDYDKMIQEFAENPEAYLPEGA